MALASRRPTVPSTELEHSAFCRTEDELPSKPLAEEMAVNVRWQQIPPEYLHFTADELDVRIGEARRKLGSKITILGHHYQWKEVIKYADFQGDSYLLSREAASRPDADYIIFCGVHFMAETACILAAPHQKVILPNITAGCSMADMAPMEDVEDAWADLEEVLGPNGIVPVTYMNSIAGIKALCGRNGGIVCTSSNAKAALKWAFEQGERVLFLPDQHLGRNTALELGVPLDEMVVWNPFRQLGGNTPEQVRRAKMVLWQGHCSVHTRFTVGQIEAARALHPDINIVVHPECPMETVQAADMVGSTEFIREQVNFALAGTSGGSAPRSAWSTAWLSITPTKQCSAWTR
jgi:quinolinate synthase